ncbi:MAG: mechanosensitive ion channel family protein [Gammaproteobacteria bacterium]|nr:mechanosensitive ion channel family protein [Gammaproteobacteria bacterium]MDH3508139.1 mechanosensitive ion channel family protein [Gammaproteobacteria bacterium]
MEELSELTEIASAPTAFEWAAAVVILVIGLVLSRVLSQLAYRAVIAPMGAHTAATLRRVILYLLIALTLMVALRELGFSLGVLLGAAGILSIALGFASQTSASNLVSGVFLVAEKAFMVGDTIKVGETTGEVLSIDLLSVKLRTYDNLYVRVPNETLIKSEITNITRFKIRRYDLQIGVAYKEDVGRVHELLISVADEFDLCLDQPRPLVIFQGFGESSIDLQFSVWASRNNFLELRNQMPARVKEAFDKEGIEIPFPHRTLYTGSLTEAFPIASIESTSRER